MSGKVFLWAAPRTLSTAFTRAMLNLDDCKVFMEPYQFAYYLGPSRTNQRYASEPINPDLTYENVTESICKEYPGKRHVFCKEMAYFFEGRFQDLQRESLKDFQHTFLIRDPKKAIQSLYRFCLSKYNPNWENFDPEGCGFRQLFELYEFVKKKMGSRPLVILADDLLKDPEKVLKSFCDYTGLTYKEGMSGWEPGVIEGWEPAPFFAAVFNSSGNGRSEKPNNLNVDNVEYPEIVQKAIEESMWYYQQLYEERFRF